MNIQLVKKSSNAKTGPIPISNSSRATCPKACPFIKQGCYADAGYHTRLNWDAVTAGKRGTDFDSFCESIAALPDGQLWRHNVSGDLVGVDNKISKSKLRQLTQANTGRRGFTYTHYPLDVPGNHEAIVHANWGGFTVNVSANSAQHAADLYNEYHLPTVAVLPIEAPRKQVIDGVTIVICPATYRDDVTCASCKLCAVSDRSVVVGFPAHGASAKKVELIAKG